ncbi:MAG: hypothetical protein R3C56_17645 [Pirellulaceae bacterium]
MRKQSNNRWLLLTAAVAPALTLKLGSLSSKPLRPSKRRWRSISKFVKSCKTKSKWLKPTWKPKTASAARGEFEKVIGLVSDLLGAGYPQPWMYQALSLAMEACDYPGAEILRVQLSSLDFNGDINAAFKIAEYLARKG